MKKLALLLTCFFVLALAGSGWGAVWHVATDGSDLNDGQSWTTPFGTIQKAIDSATGGDEIWVAAGTYPLSDYILVGKPVAIYGGFNGTETQLEERDWVTNVTTVDGNNAFLCFYVTQAATIDGFTVTNGYSYYNGGGMRVYRCAPTISNCIFSANSSDFNGGGIQNYLYASPTITNCTFSGNEASWYDGGGVYNFMYSSPTLINCLFYGNSANRDGGGMANYYQCSPTLTNCTFYGNSAGVSGGGIYNYSYASPTITNSILWADSAPAGAELYSDVNSSPSISYSDIQGGYLGTGNIDADPDFVDPASGDFHLSRHSPSPCIDTGDPSAPSLPATDFEGDPRIVFSGPDMGVDECIEEEVEGLAVYVLYAKDEVELEEIGNSKGHVGSNRKIEIDDGRCGTLQGDLRAIGEIEVDGSITIDGNVVTNDEVDMDGSWVVTGTVTEDGELTPIEFPELDFDAGSPDIRVDKRESLDAGTYGKVRVKKYATLYLSGGDYYMEKFEVDKHATVVIDGPATVNVVERLDVDKYAEIEIRSGEIKDVTFNVLNDRRIEIDRYAKFKGILLAPNSKVKLDDNCELEGAVYARRISVDDGATFIGLVDVEIKTPPAGDPSELTAIADSWVHVGKSGSDGDGNHLKIQRDRKVAFVKFDLSGVSGPVTSAQLTCTTSLHKSGMVHVHAVAGGNWVEDTINGLNAPEIGDRLDSATASGDRGEQVTWDVTQYVSGLVGDGAESVSFALVMTDGYQVYFSSRENRDGSEAPVLAIE